MTELDLTGTYKILPEDVKVAIINEIIKKNKKGINTEEGLKNSKNQKLYSQIVVVKLFTLDAIEKLSKKV